MEDNKELQELKDDELEQVTGGINPPTMFDNSVPLKKAPIAQTGKINELIKTIEASNNVIIYYSAESSSGPLDLGLKSEYKDNFNMPNQIQWEHFDLER